MPPGGILKAMFIMQHHAALTSWEKDEALLVKLNEAVLQMLGFIRIKGSASRGISESMNLASYGFEINANPCLSSDVDLWWLLCRTGLSATEVIKRLLPQRLLESV